MFGYVQFGRVDTWSGKQQGQVFVWNTWAAAEGIAISDDCQMRCQVFTGRRADIPHKQHIRVGIRIFLPSHVASVEVKWLEL